MVEQSVIVVSDWPDKIIKEREIKYVIVQKLIFFQNSNIYL